MGTIYPTIGALTLHKATTDMRSLEISEFDKHCQNNKTYSPVLLNCRPKRSAACQPD